MRRPELVGCSDFSTTVTRTARDIDPKVQDAMVEWAGCPPGDPGSANVEQMVRRMIQEVDEDIRHLEQER